VAITVYQYPKCSTCRKALQWLERQGVAVDRVDIVARPPSPATLAQVAERIGIKRMFNTSGESYRAGRFKERLATMSEAEALAALAADGKLIKRPLLVGDGLALVGFQEAEWAQALAGR
jgi:arsenate reductase (glutaredoxin)